MTTQPQHERPTLDSRAAQLGITATVRRVAMPRSAPAWARQDGATAYRASIRYEGRVVRTHYYAGSAHLDAPTAGDVLECLLIDAAGTEQASFEDWASDLGYDLDSRHAWRVYQACRRTAKRLRALLGEDTYQALAYLTH